MAEKSRPDSDFCRESKGLFLPTAVTTELDREISAMKSLLETLKRDQTTFGNTFMMMKPKDRALMMRKIQGDQRQIQTFIDKSRHGEGVNSGTRFALENLKQSFQAAMTLWRKIEKSLENFAHGSAPKMSPGGVRNETQGAVEKYVSTLRDIGQVPSSEMVTEFKNKLEAAYAKAKSQAGGKDIDIKIVKDGSKIKVRLEPKD